MMDDMGMGKTIQVIAFLSGLFRSKLAKHVMIVMPVSVIVNWEKEFAKWAPHIRVDVFHGLSPKQRDRFLDDLEGSRSGGVCLTTYGMVTSQIDALASRPIWWDAIILDEGHKIKNPNIQVSKSLRRIKSRRRFILSGTPIQNNLHEMWSLFDYIFEGKFLGSSKNFKLEFENKIVRASEKDASLFEKQLGEEIAEQLRQLIKPFCLRREKKHVLPQIPSQAPDATSVSKKGCSSQVISQKNDFIVWVKLSKKQIRIYQDFLNSQDVKNVRSPLTLVFSFYFPCGLLFILLFRYSIKTGRF